MRHLLWRLACALVLVSGCSAPKSRVHGTILYRGKPVAGGTIVFFSPDKSTSSARIQADGSYEVLEVTRGTLHVAIQAGKPRPTPRGQPGTKAAARKAGNSLAQKGAKSDDQAKIAAVGVPEPIDQAMAGFPARYGDPNRSQLSLELKDPEQEYSVDLK